MTAFSIGCTPLFLKAEPQSTGTNFIASVPLRISFAQRRDVGLLALEVGLHRRVVHLDRELDHRRAHLVGLVGELGAHRLAGPGRAEVLAGPGPLFHGHEVDVALEARSPRRSAAGSGTGVAPVRSLIIRTQLKKSAPILSILLTKTMRGTL